MLNQDTMQPRSYLRQSIIGAATCGIGTFNGDVVNRYDLPSNHATILVPLDVSLNEFFKPC
jgi:hypothetical protein